MNLVSSAAEELFANTHIFTYIKPLFEYLYHNKLPKGYNLYPSEMEVINGVFTGKVKLLHNSDFKVDTINAILKMQCRKLLTQSKVTCRAFN